MYQVDTYHNNSSKYEYDIGVFFLLFGLVEMQQA